MRRKEWRHKNLVLGVEFDKYLVQHPEILDKIPDKSTMFFLPEYDRELYTANLKLAKQGRLGDMGFRDIIQISRAFLVGHAGNPIYKQKMLDP